MIILNNLKLYYIGLFVKELKEKSFFFINKWLFLIG
jgi:hypothetical protein